MSSSADVTPVSSHDLSSPPLKGIRKVLSQRPRSSEVQDDTSSQAPELRSSVTSLTLEKSPSRMSTQSSLSRDDSSRSGSSGVRKLIPGHSKRKRRRARERELKTAVEEVERGRSLGLSPDATNPNRSTSSLVNDGNSSLLTSDSETDVAPPLVSRDSHTGYLTTSSPLIKKSTTNDPDVGQLAGKDADKTTNGLPTITIPDQDDLRTISTQGDNIPSPGLVDIADTLRPERDERGRRVSISKLRAKSPARKLKEVFAPKGGKSPKTSPERKVNEDFKGGVSNLLGKAGSFSERRLSKYPDMASPSPVDIGTGDSVPERASASLPALGMEQPPSTPPGAGTGAPVTTVTPPTPTLIQASDGSGSPRRNTDAPVPNNDSDIVVSASGNMISHRRSRSQSSLSHQPSRLSNSVLPPLTPTIEEIKTPPDKDKDKAAGARNVTPGGSFFSSWVSAAQNAASTITNSLNTHNRTKSDSSKPEASESKDSEETVRQEPSETAENEIPKKQLAIETLGSGDLNFGHLGLETSGDEKPSSPARPGLEELRKNSTIQRDEAAAKVEDMLAKRAVSAAYQTPNDQTPVAEIPDPVQGLKHTPTGVSTVVGDHSPPNDSIFGDDTGSVKRSTSMRSRMQKRRSRGSSVATGASTIGAAIVGASTATLANPATGPKLSGFAVAPKARNRGFHQQFRSVPEDDYLIEDYSCALQKEILLAGRIYISEGHICFSSNILGWVTTLVISFEEVVSIERETTAMVFPNAIAIQTLHARHTFRSLLSREATYDLMIGIWKVSHPASFKKSVNGKQLMEQEAAKQQETVTNALAADGVAAKSDDESDVSDSGGSDEGGSEGGASLAGSAPSAAGSEGGADTRSLSRKASGLNGTLAPPTTAAAPAGAVSPEGSFGVAASTSAENAVDYPGPVTHAPTECSDSATHYDKVLKDEVIPAPLGKIYSLLYGPQSGPFVRKYLLEEQKAQDLQLEDDKRGLTNESRSRQYSYIKPIGGIVKQTKCTTTETLDFFDLEKAVSVTCVTQTPDVPSGNAFSVKTRYCLSWAPGNATRLQMNCGIEWTARSLLKGPIERGANDGQQSYGDGLVRALRAAVETKKVRERGATGLSKGSAKKRKRKGRKGEEEENGAGGRGKVEEKKRDENWGLFEPLRGFLQPVVGMLGPWTVVGLLLMFMTLSWIRTPRTPATGAAGVGFPGFGQSSDRLAAYEEMWRRQESELWDWLEERVGVENLRNGGGVMGNNGQPKSDDEEKKQAAKQRARILRSKDVERRLREERMSEREMKDQIRVTGERLGLVERAVDQLIAERRAAEQSGEE